MNITPEGFREASHIERSLTIEWKEADILNLVVRPILANESIRTFNSADKREILSDAKNQEKFLYKVFPK
jgi:hypothetical protein